MSIPLTHKHKNIHIFQMQHNFPIYTSIFQSVRLNIFSLFSLLCVFSHLVHIVIHWYTLVDFGRLWSTLVNFGTLFTRQYTFVNFLKLGPFLSSVVNSGPLGPGSIWICIGLFSSTFVTWVHFGPLLSALICFGPVWSSLATFGQL